MEDFWLFLSTKLTDFLTYTGFACATYGNVFMILVGAFFVWLAIKRNFEPLLLIPIGLGIILGNIPFKEVKYFIKLSYFEFKACFSRFNPVKYN